jgi:peptidoglycan/LPS O-acetylase OafA/YrhL
LLRALAVVLVVVYHAGLFGFALPFHVQRFGWIGVDLFFVLSGYLIAGQLLRSIAQGKSPTLAQFYWRRCLRIVPAYTAIVALYFFLPPGLREYERIPPAWKFASFTQNFGLRGGTAFSHAWSLCIEAQFYFVLPFVLLALARVGRSAQSFLAISLPILILVSELLIRGSLAQINLEGANPSFGWWQQWIYYPTYSRLDSLTLGIALAAIEVFRPIWWAALEKMAGWLLLAGLLAVIVALVLAENGLSLASSAFGFSLVSLGCATFLISAVSPYIAISRTAIPGAAFLATMAYSIYLSHKLMIHLVGDFCTAHTLSSSIAYLLMLAAVLVMGALLFFSVERPFLKLRQRTREIKIGAS